ncbi:MFS transporter [Halioxenophilus aromaticivorans]|uniref:MFS transporter n=1 Tax=Halioxenophilus aromaticivorans TaxID=1306992 RepID=A0AAV3U441_9ALTE
MSQDSPLDNTSFSALQWRVLIICFLLNMLDGIDVLAISFAAPVIAQDWSITPQGLGIIFSSALVGMAIGAVFISPYTDKIGRRKMILASIAVIAVGMLATALVDSVYELATIRLIAGIGIGSMLASLTAMVSEYAPEKHRNIAILTLHAAYPIGAIIAGFVAAWMLPVYGWRPLFIFAGVISLVAVPLVFFALPESLAFLLGKQPANALVKINRILLELGRPPWQTLPQKSQAAQASSGLKALFVGELKSATAVLWLAFMMSFATLYFLFSWVVKLAVEAGLPLEKAMYAGIALNLGAFFGSVSLGYLSEKLGLKRLIFAFFIAGAVMSVAYGNASVSVVSILVLIFFLMFFVQGGFTGLYAVAARLYPTEIRTTGVGWAIGAGRVGAIVGPTAAGFILATGLSVGWTFVIFAVPLVVAALAVSQFSNSSIQ